MNTCTFFGHKDAPPNLKPALKEKITELIEQHGVSVFYVGNHGQFDSMALASLRELTKIYPHIRYYVVLAYFPKEKSPEENTLLPEGIELCHPKSAVNYRNKWMLNKAEYVITHVTRKWGGAYSFYKRSIKQNRKVINITENEQ